MHLGLPVVASNCKPIERILQDSDSGLIHLSGDPEDLARAVISLAENPGTGSEKGENGRRSFATRYNWEMTSSGLATFYRKLLVCPDFQDAGTESSSASIAAILSAA